MSEPLTWITSATVKDLFGIRGKVDIELRGINLVTGRNNVGKTSLMRAIALVLGKTEPLYQIPVHFISPPISVVLGTQPWGLMHVASEEGNALVTVGSSKYEMHARRPTAEEIGARAQSDFCVALYEYSKSLSSTELQGGIRVLMEKLGCDTSGSPWKLSAQQPPAFSDDELEQAIITSSFLSVGDSEFFVPGRKYLDLIPRVLTKRIIPANEMEPVTRLIHNTNLLMGYMINIITHYIDALNKNAEMARRRSEVPLLYTEIHDPNIYSDERVALHVERYLKELKLLDNLKRFNFNELVLNVEGKEVSFPLHAMGSGLQSFVYLLARIARSEGLRILLLEEPELHMHPGYIKELSFYLTRIAREKGVQLIIATHSFDMIRDFVEAEHMPEEERNFLKEELAVIHMSRTEDEKSRAYVEKWEDARSDLEEIQWDLRGI